MKQQRNLFIFIGIFILFLYVIHSNTNHSPPPPPPTTTATQIAFVPINMSTNIGAVTTNFSQIGILTPLNRSSDNNILPLMGRTVFTNRNKWQYYTVSNQHNNIRLPVYHRGRNGLDEYGIDEIYTGDAIIVEGYNNGEKFVFKSYSN